jgi:hypothetical protein
MTLGEAREHIGHSVVYRSHNGVTEYGVITSVGRVWVMVRYGSDQHSKGTDPAALALLSAEVES